MGQNTPGAAKPLGYSYVSFHVLLGFMGHREQSQISLLHSLEISSVVHANPAHCGDDANLSIGLPQGPIPQAPIPEIITMLSGLVFLSSHSHVGASFSGSWFCIIFVHLLPTLQKYDFNATTPT